MNDAGFTYEYWERWWSQTDLSVSPQEEERIRETLSLFPEGCSSILDVGCGDGRITNKLASRYNRVIGLDNSKKTLEYVKTERILGTTESLPFSDRSFDLVLCCEVLEHLPFSIFSKTVSELQRVADKYICVSVPYKQNLRKAMVRCPYCGCEFVPARHVRVFDLNKSLSLFGNFTAQRYVFGDPRHKEYSKLVIKIAQLLGFFLRGFPPQAVCPQCGYSVAPKDEPENPPRDRQDGLLVRVVRPWAKRLVPAKRKPLWLMILYRRNDIY